MALPGTGSLLPLLRAPRRLSRNPWRQGPDARLCRAGASRLSREAPELEGLSRVIRPPRKFEDLEVGETRRSGPRTVSEAEMVEFARQYDPQWFHADVEAARESSFGEVVASGVFVLALWRQLDHTM